MSSPAKERDIENVKKYVEHLSGIRFNGTLLIVFEQGSLKYISRKEELSADLLDRFLHRPVIVKTKKPTEIPKPESVESPETSANSASTAITAKTNDETTPEAPGKF
jgi:flavodoxin